jgi:hypothetical protein
MTRATFVCYPLGRPMNIIYINADSIRSARDQSHPLAGQGWHASQFYGAVLAPDGQVSLDGACGLESMRTIAEALGLTVEQSSTRSGLLLTIRRKGA